MDLLVSTAVIALFALGTAGWGLVLLRVDGGERRPVGPLAAAIGIAAWGALGAPLMLAGAARGIVLDLALGVGIVLALSSMLGETARRRMADALMAARRAPLATAAAWLPVAATFGFLLYTLVPSDYFTERDDLRKYLGHLQRLLQTGTIAGSPVNSTGSETLGLQTFLQAWVASHLSLLHVLAVDNVLGLALLMALPAAHVVGPNGRCLPALAAMLLALAIHPMIINVSAVYSAAIVVCALSLVIARQPRDGFRFRHGAVPGAAYAFLVAVKPIFAVFVGFHAVAVAALLIGRNRRAADGARWIGHALVWALLFIAPWLLVHAGDYIAAFGGGALDLATEGLAYVDEAAQPNPAFSFLATDRLPIGGTPLAYTVIAALLFAAGVRTVARSVRNPAPGNRGIALAAGALALPAAFVVQLALLAPRMSGPEHMLRMLAPELIGVAVAVALLWAEVFPGRRDTAILVAASAVVAALFAPTITERAEYAWRYHTLRTYPHGTEPFLVDYIHSSVGDTRRRQIGQLQALVPAGDSILAWTASPYFLDFSRNPIIDVEVSGTSMPWAGEAFAMKPKYVIWQVRGMVMEQFPYLQHAAAASWSYGYDRRYYRAAAAFGVRLSQLVKRGETIGRLNTDDESWVVVRLPVD